MTKEEAIETIKDICLTTEQLTRIEKALECLLSKPSLPSNLDEAAKEYNRNYIPFDQCDRRDIIHTFKAGAEWMAGQGVSFKWHNATEIPSPDIEVIAEVNGFKHAQFCVLKHTEDGWWQHIPKVFDQMPCDGWVGTGDVRVIRWIDIKKN